MQTTDPASPQLGNNVARFLGAALLALAIAAASIFAFGSYVILREGPSAQLLSEFGILAAPYGTYPGSVLPASQTSEGRRQGFTRPARLVAVNGRPVSGPLTTERLATLLRENGRRASLELAPRAGLPLTVLLTRRLEHAHEPWGGTWLTENKARLLLWITQFAYLLVGLFAATLLVRRRPRDPVVLLFAFQAIVFTATATVGWRACGELGILAPARGIDALANVAIVALLFLFPDGRVDGRGRRALLALFLSAVGARGAVLAADLELSTVERQAVDLGALVATLAAVPILYGKYRAVQDVIKRQQLKAAMLGLGVATSFILILIPLGNVATRTTSPQMVAFAGLINVTLSVVASIIIAAGFLVALLRFKLYDADRAISRSFAFGALTLGLLGIFAGTEKIVELLGEQYFGKSIGALAGGIGAALAAVLLVPVHNRLRHWAEHRFRKDLIRLRDGLPAIVGELRETAGPERIAAAVLDAVRRGVHSTRAALITADTVEDARGIDVSEVVEWRGNWTPAPHDRLDCVPSDPLFPVRVPLDAEGHDRVGWLLLGPRPDGSLYGKDEREVLAKVADPVARALEIVRAREARETETRQCLRSQEEQSPASREGWPSWKRKSPASSNRKQRQAKREDLRERNSSARILRPKGKGLLDVTPRHSAAHLRRARGGVSPGCVRTEA